MICMICMMKKFIFIMRIRQIIHIMDFVVRSEKPANGQSLCTITNLYAICPMFYLSVSRPWSALTSLCEGGLSPQREGILVGPYQVPQ